MTSNPTQHLANSRGGLRLDGGLQIRRGNGIAMWSCLSGFQPGTNG